MGIHSCSRGRTEMKKTLTATGWQSYPDPTGRMMHDKGPVKVPAQAQALEWMLGLDECTPLPA